VEAAAAAAVKDVNGAVASTPIRRVGDFDCRTSSLRNEGEERRRLLSSLLALLLTATKAEVTVTMMDKC